ncbi:long-chain fatty acid transport protein 4-like isoform X2 [Artemia franciscana]|uniref:long-chain fatty acid transport protein 4-like isoform X2 n=1 Tax=Artemia franciscana TaxID=6661 RepID=UPI0032DB5092
MYNKGILYGVIAGVLYTVHNIAIWKIILLLLTVYALTGGHKYLWKVYKTLPRDAKALWRYLKVLRRMKYCQKNNLNVPMIFEENVRRHPDKVCFIYEDREWTFAEVDEYSNRVANFFSSQGLEPGATVALFMENRPEYVCLWLGLAKAGLVTALINYNLKDIPLIHSISCANSKAIIVELSLVDSYASVKDRLDESLPLFVSCLGKDSNMPSNVSGGKNLDAALETSPTSPLSGPQRANYSDKMLYIYTSGTTGLPKAAVIRHSRYLFAATGGYFAIGMNSSDVAYVPLPLYHTAGGILGAGMIFFGLKVVLRKKFSVSNFWSDCAKHQCTVAQYIGETCRYLLSSPERPEERKHKVRLMYGNGLRPQIWEQFVKRFGVKHIAEFYGATEGNANIINTDGKIGAVGFVSVINPEVYPVSLIKVDEYTGEPIRRKDGLCTRCQPGETGMFVGKIVRNHPVRDFHGYADEGATKKKVLEDVFEKGDVYFLSGDIMMMDELGYLFFKDRTGDTFRWRGENVSTTEVESVVMNVAKLKCATVYGVEVPGSEGRAGMTAILDNDDSLDLDELAAGLKQALPPYARPLFVRSVKEMDMTGTYKLRKVDFQKEGFDPLKIKDKLFMFDSKADKYVPLTEQVYSDILSGKVRL